MTAPANVRTCYRHPDRAAGITCQRCERPICPACMQQASVGFHCPECARSGAQREYRGVAALRTQPIATYVIMGVNLVAYLAMLATRSVTPFSEWGKAFAFRFEDIGGLYADGLLFGPAVPEEPWRVLSSAFLHSNDFPFGLLHIGFNMLALWSIGRMLEPAVGRAGFVALYFAALFGGSLGALLVTPESFTVGASGAVFGVLGGLVVVARARGVDLVRSGLAGTLGFWLLWTFAIPNISIGGHLGGLVAGALAGLVLVVVPQKVQARGQQVAVGIVSAGAVALAVASWVVMTAQYPQVG